MVKRVLALLAFAAAVGLSACGPGATTAPTLVVPGASEAPLGTAGPTEAPLVSPTESPLTSP
jgi:hypothetical protein